MKATTGMHDAPHENRRTMLKKVGAASTFAVPAVASFTFSELKVHASGLPNNNLETTWTNYWSTNNSFWGSTAGQWSTMKETWYSIFMAFGPHA